MRILNRKFLLSCASLLLAGGVWAQPAPGTDGGPGPGPGMGMKQGMGPGADGSKRPCMQADMPAKGECGMEMQMRHRRHQPGDRYMTPEERRTHRDRLRGFKSREECLAYLNEHHAQMAERAKAKGRTLPEPRTRACDRLPPAR